MDFTKRMKEDRLRTQVAIALAAAAVGTSMEEVAGGVRTTKVAFARQVAMYVACVGFGMSLARVAAQVRPRAADFRRGIRGRDGGDRECV